MVLDPQVRALLEDVARLNLPPTHTLSPKEARDYMRARPVESGPEVAAAENRTIVGPGGPIPIRMYRPFDTGLLPALLWFHGGGMVLGDLDRADATARHLCIRSGCVVVSVDYRLAPEHKFPAAPNDCYAATKWAAENANSLQIDQNRIAVGGDSAGGNLAAVVALMARDMAGPTLVHQLLVYPMSDYNFDTKSYLENADDYSLTRDTMKWFWDHYLAKEQDATNPYAAPLRASNLEDLPPALVITAEYDPLRDEGEAYAKRLEAASIQTTCSRYEGVIHGFFGMPSMIDKGNVAITQAAEALKSAFAR